MAFSSATGGGKAAPRGPGPDAVWPSPSAARPARGKRTPRSPRLALANTFAIAGGSASEEVPGELPALVPRSLTRTAHGPDLGRGRRGGPRSQAVGGSGPDRHPGVASARPTHHAVALVGCQPGPALDAFLGDAGQERRGNVGGGRGRRPHLGRRRGRRGSVAQGFRVALGGAGRGVVSASEAFVSPNGRFHGARREVCHARSAPGATAGGGRERRDQYPPPATPRCEQDGNRTIPRPPRGPVLPHDIAAQRHTARPWRQRPATA